MKWLIFEKESQNYENSLARYQNFIDSSKFTGIWHQIDWLSFQIASKKVVDGFFFGIEKENNIILAGLFLIYKSKNFKYGYIPAGFLYFDINDDIYNFFLQNIDDIAKKNNLLFTSVDSITPKNDMLEQIIQKSKNHKLNVKLPIPQYTNVIDLNLSEEEILKQMKPKGRYNIKLAEKKDVKVRIGDINDVSIFYQILKETTERDGFRPNPEEYYSIMLEKLKNSIILVATHETDILSCGIFTYTKYQGLYYYGASSNLKRNFMSPYLLQWEAIKIAKQKGCDYFDFLGIAAPDNPTDPLSGVTDFKLKFSENIICFQTPYHIIHKKFIYSLFGLIKNIKAFLSKKHSKKTSIKEKE
ncbi:MAG: hypothetical protein A2086_14315 [Spirochaetes bacterium GWD1_27_9]|nr:MAG: hypothetical protein A2Y34_00570 [Spirochaetes bacterium GWC1_27_15]OHD41232.1 MAG: hypothetical protein A2086_14315 [Spirochaetes bacterium GWD1_27_9]